MTDSAEVVVVGAGLAGLAATLHLCAAGLDVRLLEAGAGAGGRVGTDLVDGFLLDHGFQVHDTAYPEPARVLDVGALDLRPFLPGALVYLDGRLHHVMDPRRRPRDLVATLRAPVGPLMDKLRAAQLAARVTLTPHAGCWVGRRAPPRRRCGWKGCPRRSSSVSSGRSCRGCSWRAGSPPRAGCSRCC